MSNVLSLKHLKNNVSRNGFDMSEKRAFTAKVGEILPCFVLETIPGDRISINPSHFTRTMPVNTAAFTQLKEYIHYYYVPYSQLYKDVREFFSESEDSKKADTISSNKKIGRVLPYLTHRDIAQYVYNVSIGNKRNSANQFSAYGTCKLLEYLGYGSYWEFIAKYKPHTSNVENKEPYTEGDESINSLDSSDGYPDYFSEHPNSDFINSKFNSNIRLNPFALLAYQKIYQDHFRNKSWENFNASACNIDYMDFGSKIPVDKLRYKGTDVVNDMFSLRYCDYAKDFFFGLLPKAQYGESTVIPLSGSYSDIRTVDPAEKIGDWQWQQLLDNIADNGKFGASVVALRRAEALQKYKEIKATGITDYKSYLDKIFNVEISDFDSGQAIYLGGYNSDVNISEVVNTSLNNDGIADIKGKGVASGGSDTINFDAKDYGVIIGVYTCRPVLDYDIDAPIKTNQRIFLEDYANPVFDKIGMETVHMNDLVMPYSFYSYHDREGTGLIEDKSDNVKAFSPVGYAPRYYSYKTNYDKVLGEFRNTLASWVSPIKTSDFLDGAGMVDPLKVNISNRYNNDGVYFGQKLNALTYQSFKVKPQILNTIFVQHVDDTLSTDQLLVNFSTNCPIVRNLDYDGLPY